MCKQLPCDIWFGCMNKIKGDMERGWGVASCVMVIVLKKSPKEAIGEGAVQLQWRPQHIGDARTIGWPPSTAAAAGWSWPEQTSLCYNGRSGEVRLWSPLEPRRSWVPDVGHSVTCTIFSLALIWFVCNCSLVLLSWSEKVCNLALFVLQEST